MTVSELAKLIDARFETGDAGMEREVASGYVCDLLSWVMSHGVAGTAWVTVQTHLNVVAVATLLDLACVIVPEGIGVPGATAEKAVEEEVAVLTTNKTAYEIAVLMASQGIPPTSK